MKTQSNPTPTDPFKLMRWRVHEAQGPGRRGFAVFQAARHQGPLIWIIPAHLSHNPMPRGLPDGIGQRIHLIRLTSKVDLLSATEEALLSWAPDMVISEPEKPLSLNAGRRLQLATETRWHCAPVAGECQDSTAHQWEPPFLREVQHLQVVGIVA